MGPRPRILLIARAFQTFVQEDLAHLRSFAEVDVFHFDLGGPASRAERARRVAAALADQARWLRRHLPGADAVYGWFADTHLVLPTRAAQRSGTPVLVAVGGFDANVLPALGYGVYASRWRAPLARYVLRNAARVLPCSGTLLDHTNTYSDYPRPLRNGIRAHVPGFDAPVTVLPSGFDGDEWPLGPTERPEIVVTVGHVGDERTQRIKGLDVLIGAARHLPDVAVQIVGVPPGEADALRQRFDAPPNVALLPPRPRADLAPVYAGASVYAQLSRAEGQPNVLGEAMCCGCIPVGSPVFGIPETIGETGYLVERPDPEHVAAVLRRALDEATPDGRRAARERILTHYSRAQRREGLRQAVFETLAERSAGAAS